MDPAFSFINRENIGKLFNVHKILFIGNKYIKYAKNNKPRFSERLLYSIK